MHKLISPIQVNAYDEGMLDALNLVVSKHPFPQHIIPLLGFFEDSEEGTAPYSVCLTTDALLFIVLEIPQFIEPQMEIVRKWQNAKDFLDAPKVRQALSIAQALSRLHMLACDALHSKTVLHFVEAEQTVISEE